MTYQQKLLNYLSNYKNNPTLVPGAFNKATIEDLIVDGPYFLIADNPEFCYKVPYLFNGKGIRTSSGTLYCSVRKRGLSFEKEWSLIVNHAWVPNVYHWFIHIDCIIPRNNELGEYSL